MGWEEQVEEEEEGGRIPDPSRLSVGPVKGKPVRNKSLSVGFDEKGLRDFITGFHKRKKRRQKEAQQQLEEKARKLRIEQRKKRKLEIQLAYGGGPVNPDTVPDDDPCNKIEEDGEDFHGPSITGTTVYNNGVTTITVTTSELCGEENKDVHMWDHVAERHAIPIKERVLKVIKTHAKLSRKANVLKRGSARKPGKGSQRHGGERKGIKGSKKQVGKWENMAHGSRQTKGKRKVRK